MLWDPFTGQQLLRLHSDNVGAGSDVAISPDSAIIAGVSGLGGRPVVTIWDARAPSAELRTHLDAASFIRSLEAWQLPEDEAVRRIGSAAAISAEVRQRALDLVARYTGDVEINTLNSRSWEIVRRPGASPKECRLAVRLAETVCQFKPDSGTYLNTLGIAQYRAGKYEVCLETLTRSSQLNGGRQPADIAFLAMAQHRLGQIQGSRKTLALLQDLFNKSRTDDTTAFLEEAKSLILRQPDALPKQVFAP
jgi:hypothetical protein